MKIVITALTLLFISGCTSLNTSDFYTGDSITNCNEYIVFVEKLTNEMYSFELKDDITGLPVYASEFSLETNKSFMIFNYNGKGDSIKGHMRKDGSIYGIISDIECSGGILGNFQAEPRSSFERE